jgi:hypothetical protein
MRVTKKMGKLWTRVVDGAVVPLLPSKYANLFQSSKRGLWNKYFMDADAEMQSQWDEIIWPLIKDFDSAQDTVPRWHHARHL